MRQAQPDTPANFAKGTSGAPAEGCLTIDKRRRRICELLSQHGQVTVADLARRFSTSLVTIRLDLTALQVAGALSRTRGGALVPRESDDLPIGIKQTLHHAQKERIARTAAALIQDGETIILDSGTTTAEIARQIRALQVASINVITNALNIAVLLADVPAVRLIMLGGVLRSESNSLSGHLAENALGGLQAHRLFLGLDGLDPEIGVMTPHLAEAQLNAKMIQSARQVIAVTDSSKLMRRTVSVIAQVEQIHMLITDKGARADVVAALRVRGIDVRLV